MGGQQVSTFSTEYFNRWKFFHLLILLSSVNDLMNLKKGEIYKFRETSINHLFVPGGGHSCFFILNCNGMHKHFFKGGRRCSHLWKDNGMGSL